MRTTTRLVSFTQPFALNGIDGLLPAGSYRVDTDEETIDSLAGLLLGRYMPRAHPPQPTRSGS